MKWFKNRTDRQKGYLWWVASLLSYYLIYFLVKKTVSFLIVIPLLFFVRAGAYWFCEPSERKIRFGFKIVLFILLIILFFFLLVEFYLRILGEW